MKDISLTRHMREKYNGSNLTKLALVNKSSFKTFGRLNITDGIEKYLFIFTVITLI